MRLQRINAMQNLCAGLPLRQRHVMGKFAETATANLFIQSSICAERRLPGTMSSASSRYQDAATMRERMPRSRLFLTSANLMLPAACSTEEAQAVMTG
jgi:hypothetical protein